MVDKRRLLGDTGEQLAAEQLVRSGLRIVATWLVLVEVRTRRGERFGSALQSITPAKQRKLRTVAAEYLQSIGWSGPWRIDVVAVQMDGRGVLQGIEHVRHAVGG
jgi:putative endonuclease